MKRVVPGGNSSSSTLNYLEHFGQQQRRLREAGLVFRDYGLRIGVEYHGTKHLWTSGRHSFVHTMAECLELISATGQENIGFVLDSWRWWTARASADDIRSLNGAQVIVCDLNDAASGVAIDDQVDCRRGLPGATGVIDLKGFLEALVSIGFDGPIRAEAFSKRLEAMDDDEAAATVAKAMKRAIAPFDE